MHRIFLTGFFILFADIIWVSLSKSIYMKQYLDLASGAVSFKSHWMYILLSYIFVLGLFFTVALSTRSWLDAAKVGFLSYGVYNATNLATMSHYNPRTAFMDTCWGNIIRYGRKMLPTNNVVSIVDGDVCFVTLFLICL